MNPHPKIKIAAFNGSTVSKREPHDVDANVMMQPYPTALDGIEAELDAKREAEAMHIILNGLRSKLALEGSVDDEGPSDALVMDAVEGSASERVMENRYMRARG